MSNEQNPRTAASHANLSCSEREGLSRLLARGVVFYDSDSNRAAKNAKRIKSPVNVRQVSSLNGNGVHDGLVYYVQNGSVVYIVNSFDMSSSKAVSMICSQAIESDQHYRIIFLGQYDEFVRGELETARSISANIKYTVVDMHSAFLDPQRPVDLAKLDFR